LIYLSLAIISAPKGAIVNRTMFTALVFVAINLSVTAATSKEWYERKFGREAVAHRWKMMPFVY
jgi:3-oxo-5-alpha-steroid 4-dehydrogenase 3